MTNFIEIFATVYLWQRDRQTDRVTLGFIVLFVYYFLFEAHMPTYYLHCDK